MSLPWLHRWIGTILDRWWLGRGFGTVDAVKHFLAGLRSATTEEQLIESAQAGLTRIFDAPAAVRLESRPQPAPEFDVVEDVEVWAGAGMVGRFLMGTRRSDAPYFSEDIALLASLADVFASVLDNVHLQKREQEQDRRAQELSLHASRSELKALRAQINPHFFFNALNAIANLVHQNPAEADRTIEKLADVFRYALRGGESEWALLDEELQFVRAYLEVEQARFGSRLLAEVHLAENARGALVPTMVVQTLVENAIKHGAAATRGQAIVRIDARRDDDRLRIAVEDNGPGFEQPTGANLRPARHATGGFGLVNVRRRLEGHFGNGASLTIGREASQGLTVVLLTLPFVREEPRAVTPAATAEAPR
jgi:signal transduction histidine kinase